VIGERIWRPLEKGVKELSHKEETFGLFEDWTVSMAFSSLLPFSSGQILLYPKNYNKQKKTSGNSLFLTSSVFF